MVKGTRAKGKKISVHGGIGRLYVVGAILLGASLLVLGRVAQQQIISGEEGKDFLQAQGKARSLREEPMLALRGMITDRHGEPLAIRASVMPLWAHPRLITVDYRPLSALAIASSVSEKLLVSKVTPGKGFVYLKRQISPVEAVKIMALDYDRV